MPKKTPHFAFIYFSLYVFGGMANLNNVLNNELHCFDTEAETWAKLETTGNIPSPRHSHSATVIGPNRVLIFGGGGDDIGRLSDAYFLEMGTLTWTKM